MLEQLHPQPDHRHVEDDQQDVADPEARDQAPEDVGVLADQLRAGNDAVNDQRAQQQRHHGVAGNAEAHGRDEVALHRGMRRRLGACDALDRAVTETLRRLRYLLLGGVGHERGDGRSGARNQRAEAAEKRAADHRPERQLEIGLRRKHVGDADLGVSHVDVFGVVDAVHELGDAEHAERQRDDFDAVEQFGDAEGEAGLPGLDVGADDADQQAEHRHRDALERRSLRQRRARQQSDQHQRTHLGGSEFERHLDQERRQENHLGDAEGSADEGGDDGDAERGAALALFGQRKPVQTGHGVRRMARQIEQNRADRSAILGAVIDAGQHQDRRHRLHSEGQRQQDRDRRDRTHSRQHADEVADQHAEEAVHQVVRLERYAEAVPEIGNRR